MTDFAGGLADWDLTAVVSGYSAASSLDDDHLLFGNFVFPEYLFDDNYSSTISNSDLELNDLYKPFYPPSFDQYPSTPTPPPPPENLLMVKDEEKPEPIPVPEAAADSCSKATVGNKYRIRKNQQKRVVMEVTGEGHSSDMWAWRKYGQKPIKGSPYPRSYYRCSSSKGCPARKMVERSHLNPTTFIITYTGDHNHAKPTRRNSLAGTTRQRFSPVPTPTTTEEICSGYTGNNMTRAEKTKKIRGTGEINYGGGGEVIISDHHHMMVIGDDDDSFLSALTASKSNDFGFYQEHGDSSFW